MLTLTKPQRQKRVTVWSGCSVGESQIAQGTLEKLLGEMDSDEAALLEHNIAGALNLGRAECICEGFFDTYVRIEFKK
jgi:hypothetical protein